MTTKLNRFNSCFDDTYLMFPRPGVLFRSNANILDEAHAFVKSHNLTPEQHAVIMERWRQEKFTSLTVEIDYERESTNLTDRFNLLKVTEFCDSILDAVNINTLTDLAELTAHPEFLQLLDKINYDHLPENYATLGIDKPEGYRKTGIGISRIKGVERAIDPRLTEYLRKHKPEDLVIQQRLIQQRKTEDQLSEEERAFLSRYFTFFPSPEKIPSLMDTFLKKFRDSVARNEDPIKIAAFVHQSIVKIHPYPEGNGRLARFMMNLVLILGAGIEPIGFSSNEAYTKAVSQNLPLELGVGDEAFETFLQAQIRIRKTAKEMTPVFTKLFAMIEKSFKNKEPAQAIVSRVYEHLKAAQ